jgi:hypothetical protein
MWLRIRRGQLPINAVTVHVPIRHSQCPVTRLIRHLERDGRELGHAVTGFRALPSHTRSKLATKRARSRPRSGNPLDPDLHIEVSSAPGLAI